MKEKKKKKKRQWAWNYCEFGLRRLYSWLIGDQYQKMLYRLTGSMHTVLAIHFGDIFITAVK